MAVAAAGWARLLHRSKTAIPAARAQCLLHELFGVFSAPELLRCLEPRAQGPDVAHSLGRDVNGIVKQTHNAEITIWRPTQQGHDLATA